MPLYLVRWEVDIHAENPQEAAEKARKIQLTPNNKATAFDVLEPAAPAKPRRSRPRITTIDLSCPEETHAAHTSVEAEWDAEAEVWVATSPDVPGLVLQGRTTEELIEKLRLVLPSLIETGIKPDDRLNITFRNKGFAHTSV